MKPLFRRSGVNAKNNISLGHTRDLKKQGTGAYSFCLRRLLHIFKYTADYFFNGNISYQSTKTEEKADDNCSERREAENSFINLNLYVFRFSS